MFKTDSMDLVENKIVDEGKKNPFLFVNQYKRSKGNPFLFVDQYQFYYSDSNKNKTKYYWKCMNYNTYKCKGRAHTNSTETNAILIKNVDHTCVPNLQSNIPMPTTPTSMPSDPTAATYGTPPLTTSVSATPSISSLIDSENHSMIKARVSDGNLNASRHSREMLCNENSPISSDSTDAHEMSKDYCNGEIVDDEKQTYTYDKKLIAPTTPPSMPYNSDPTAAATPPLTTSVSATPSISSLINSENPSMLKVFVGNLNEGCVSREMLCNENSPILSDSTDAHKMSKDYCNGEIVDEEQQPYTYVKKPIAPTTTTSTTSGGINGSNKNKFSNNKFTKNRGDICGFKQTIFNQHTTNFTVCCLNSLKPLV